MLLASDEEILELFFARAESAITELNRKYGKLCHKLSYHILNNRQDTEECVNHAYLGVWNAIPPLRPHSLQAYICKIVRNLSLKRYYENHAAKRGGVYQAALQELEAYLPAPVTVEEEIAAKDLARYIEEFMAGLTGENRVIFMLRYAYADTYAEIARRVGLPVKTISVRLARMRKRLKTYLLEREVFV